MLKQLISFVILLYMILFNTSHGQTVFEFSNHPIQGECIENNVRQKDFGNWNKTFHEKLAFSDIESVSILVQETKKIAKITGYGLPKNFGLLWTLLTPVCLNATVNFNEPMVQLVSPCRAVCRLAAREYTEEISAIMTSHKNQVFLPFPLDCRQFPRPKDVNRLCVPPPLPPSW